MREIKATADNNRIIAEYLAIQVKEAMLVKQGRENAEVLVEETPVQRIIVR